MGSDDAAARNAPFMGYCASRTETAPIVCEGQAEARRQFNTRRNALIRAATILSCKSVDRSATVIPNTPDTPTNAAAQSLPGPGSTYFICFSPPWKQSTFSVLPFIFK
jgi:hypothetical protein